MSRWPFFLAALSGLLGACEWIAPLEPVPSEVNAECAGKRPGDTFCSGKQSVTCGPDLVPRTNEMCAVACIANGQCAACIPEQKQCSGNSYQTCLEDGTWSGTVACPAACIGAGECGTCTPTEKGCSGNRVQTCREDGTWGMTTPCPFVCTGAGTCSGECKPGDKQCSGNGVQTCGPDGQWGMPDACPYVCADLGVCGGECTPNTKRCKGNGTETCSTSGLWGDVIDCPFVCTGQGDCTGICTPGKTECSGNGVQTCGPDGQWGTPNACPYVCTGLGVCGGECTPNTKRCKGNGTETCSTSGLWGDVIDCPFVCTGQGDCTGICKPGKTECSGNGVQTCGSDGQWGTPNACPYVCTGLGVCGGECTPNTKRCKGNGTETCSTSGLWGDVIDCPFVCTGQGDCTGICKPEKTRCSNNSVQTCKSNGTWGPVDPCPPATPVCMTMTDAGMCDVPRSCSALANNCGPLTTTPCCLSTIVPGGTFNRANDPMFPATVSDFRMDNFEVTVGRFRKFVAGYPANKPKQKDGKNPNNPSDIGWDPNWDAQLPTDNTSLLVKISCGDTTSHTWTPTPDTFENRPMNCVDWALAQAFCIWDGGRLPTEAEWNYAAAGGNEQRVYPWSNPPDSTTIDASYATYYGDNGCAGGADPGCQMPIYDIIVVGSRPQGKGRWGHSELAGNVAEWVGDWFQEPPNPCINCTNEQGPSNAFQHPMHGGAFDAPDYMLNTMTRQEPLGTGPGGGMRCVRLP